MRNLVVQPVCLDERHKGVNHDQSDAKELAVRLVIWQRESRLVKKWWPVFGNPRATRAAKQKAVVAVARPMAVDLWRWRTGRAQPEAFGWTMVGAATI